MVAALAAANLLLLWKFGAFGMFRRPPTQPLAALAVGQSVAPFELTSIDGSPVRLRFQAGRMLLLVFSPGCAHSWRQTAEWGRVLASQEAQDVRIVGLALPTDSPEDIRAMLETTRLKGFPVAIATPELMSSYRILSTPLTVLIGTEGVVISVWEGRWTPDTERSVLDALRGVV